MLGAKGRVGVQDKDKGWLKLLNMALELDKNPHVIVGVIGSKSDTGFEQVEIASVQEFGSERRGIPARSFIRSTFDDRYRRFYGYAVGQFDQLVTGKISVWTALERLGFLIQNNIVEKINKIRTPPLSLDTIKAKGSTKPLIDEGRLRASISFEVKRG